jgi:hypothetical protein
MIAFSELRNVMNVLRGIWPSNHNTIVLRPAYGVFNVPKVPTFRLMARVESNDWANRLCLQRFDTFPFLSSEFLNVLNVGMR